MADTAKTPRPLSIALVTETYPPEINGVANTLHRIVHGLADRGHDITLLRPTRRRKEPERVEGRVREVPTPGFPLPFYPELQIGLPASRAVARTLKACAPDIVYIATEGPLGMSAQRVARRLKVPVVAGFHTNFHTYSRHYRLGLLAPTVLAYLRRFHNRCARTLVPTRELHDALTGLNFERLAVWPRGVDIALFNPARRDAVLRDAWTKSPDDLVVIYVGRIAREKNIDLAVEAFRAIRARRPGSRFVLVGDGPELPRIRDANPDFICTGARRGEVLAAHYASADIFLFPSTSETFGNVITEAMASGLGVVAFRMAAAATLLHEGVNGLLAEPDDHAAFIRQSETAAVDDDLRRNIAAQARRDVLPFAWPDMLARLENILFDVLDSPEREPTDETMAATLE